jgi:hypothetical protein
MNEHTCREIFATKRVGAVFIQWSERNRKGFVKAARGRFQLYEKESKNMKSKMFRLSLVSALFVLASFATATAQDFHKTYSIGPNGSLSIHNVSGDVKITGYNGEGIVVAVYKEGRDQDRVEVEDRSQGNRVDLSARYESCRNCSTNASLRFEVQVPRSVNYNFEEIETASGNISIQGVTGRVRVNTASGDVLVRDVNGFVNANTASGTMEVREIAGAVKASTASCDVNVEMARVEGSENLVFSTASGNIHVKMPASLDADVAMSTSSGDIKTDFPLEVRKDEYGPQRSARGRLGSGNRLLRISSASGDIDLMRF